MLESYHAFKEEYTTALENKLEEVRASSQYIKDKQDNEKNNESGEKDCYFILLSLALYGGAMYSLLRKDRKKRKDSSTSGGN